MGNGWLVAPYGDTVPGAANVYDVKADAVRPARDIFVTVCNPAVSETKCSLAAEWSVQLIFPIQLYSPSISTDWQEDNVTWHHNFLLLVILISLIFSMRVVLWLSRG